MHISSLNNLTKLSSSVSKENIFDKNEFILDPKGVFFPWNLILVKNICDTIRFLQFFIWSCRFLLLAYYLTLSFGQF